MSDFLLYAAIVFVLLIMVIYYVYPSSNKDCTVPGLSPSTKEEGNYPDIGRAGSLHEFLAGLHRQFGPIASFWMGQKFVVSIASPELFRQHQHVFDRPPELFRLYAPILGDKGLQYANGEDGRGRRVAYDKSFSHDELPLYYPKVQKVTDDLLAKWSLGSKDEHIALGQEMFTFAIKAGLTCLLGDYFDDDKEVMTFKTNYDLMFKEMEMRQSDPTLPDKDSTRAKTFNNARTILMQTVKRVIEHRRKTGSKSEELLLIDRILDHNSDPVIGEQDCMGYLVAAFHTTGNLLTWAIYFLASHEDIEKKLYAEIISVLGEDDQINYQNITELKYLRQVIDETMRCAVIGPWGARFRNVDSELGGHKIPKNTPVIHAFGVVLEDEKIWPEPKKFDPDRFGPEHIKDHPALAFSPFGYAGKRKCPGHNFAYIESTMCLASLIRKFRISLVKGQVVKPKYGFVTHPAEEIWVTVTKRN